jgi:DNA-directed RNA polymerase subunit H
MKKKIEIKEHVLMPKHTKLNDKEKKELLEKYGISIKSLPKIKRNDQAIIALETKSGDVIKIERKSLTAGTAVYYRSVV